MSSQTQILALDLASVTGWHHSSGDGGVIDLRNKQRDWGRMGHQFNYELNELIQQCPTDKIVCELPPNRLLGAARMILLGLHWQARAIAYEYVIPFENVAVPTLKKWATGSGKATKEDMIRAARDLGGREPIDDNHADAMLLCAYAKAHA